MRIGMFTETYHPTMNGVVVSIDTFREELEKMGHEVFVVAPAAHHYRDRDSRVIRVPSIILPQEKTYPVALPWAAKLAWPRVAHLGFDLIHTHHLFTIGVAGQRIAARLKIPTVHTYHTLVTEYTHYFPFAQPLVKQTLIWWSRRFCNRAEMVIAPTPPIRTLLHRYGVKRPISVIPTGIDLARYDRSHSATFRARWHIPEHARILLYVGRIAKEKNIYLLLRIFQRLHEDDSALHLVLIGGGPELANVKRQLVRERLTGAVTATGVLPKTEAERAFGVAEVFLFPSVTDTQAIVVVEAMASGAVPVAANRQGPTSIIRAHVNGLLVTPRAKEFVDATKKILYDNALRKRMRDAGLQRAKQYNKTRTARLLNTIYEHLAQPVDFDRPTPYPLPARPAGEQV